MRFAAAGALCRLRRLVSLRLRRRRSRTAQASAARTLIPRRAEVALMPSEPPTAR